MFSRYGYKIFTKSALGALNTNEFFSGSATSVLYVGAGKVASGKGKAIC